MDNAQNISEREQRMLRRAQKKEQEERKKLRQETQRKLQMAKQEQLRKALAERTSYQTETDRLTNNYVRT